MQRVGHYGRGQGSANDCYGEPASREEQAHAEDDAFRDRQSQFRELDVRAKLTGREGVGQSEIGPRRRLQRR